MDLVHSAQVGTNLILFQARDNAEMEAKKASPWNEFLTNRQKRLEKEHAVDPAHPFYVPKAAENGAVHKLYDSDVGDEHKSFYALTDSMYRDFATGVNKLETLLELPYAASDHLTEADFHAIPWLAHAMWGAGTVPTDIQDFSVLEALVQKSVPEFKIGPRLRAWWSNVSETPAFKQVFAELH